ncbi:MAG: hypothetical protein N2202_01085 [Proteobacteria bacterium]|nr:hypothetical protein [Pseudomonadota bacterium]
MRKYFTALFFVLITYSTSFAIDDIKFSFGMTQSMFRDFSKEMGLALSYKNLIPAEPLGITGFDVGFEVNAIEISDGAWKNAIKDKNVPSYLVVPKIRIIKGLPLGIDVGAFYSQVPDSNIKIYGGELKYSILEGGVATPALAIRGTYTQLEGVSELGFKTYGLDAIISKGFFMITPYGGVGLNRFESTPKGFASAVFPTGLGLKDEKKTYYKAFVGARVTLVLLSLTGEVEFNEFKPVYSIKGAITF